MFLGAPYTSYFLEDPVVEVCTGNSKVRKSVRRCLATAVPTSTAKKPKEVMHFRVWNVTRSGNFLWVWQAAVSCRQKPTARFFNQYDKKIHSSISGHFETCGFFMPLQDAQCHYKFWYYHPHHISSRPNVQRYLYMDCNDIQFLLLFGSVL